ncbi:MAG: biotin/lipoyl attachment domain-containing protein [Ignavibacteria bacterium]|nr:MAG: biotin/lipoyl attachment domain-containing protein [Ignavibacteria bacterium]KAF0159896.1 MAG: biotin/lipoyl attachment domain-containing protein [Ignavibacteria bacterium]
MIELKPNQLVIDDTVYETKLTRKFRFRKKYEAPNPKHLNAFIPGVISDIYVKPGQHVKEGDKILILEAMKMKNTVTSEITGKVKEIKVTSGKMVTKNQLLIEFE